MQIILTANTCNATLYNHKWFIFNTKTGKPVVATTLANPNCTFTYDLPFGNSTTTYNITHTLVPVSGAATFSCIKTVSKKLCPVPDDICDFTVTQQTNCEYRIQAKYCRTDLSMKWYITPQVGSPYYVPGSGKTTTNPAACFTIIRPPASLTTDSLVYNVKYFFEIEGKLDSCDRNITANPCNIFNCDNISFTANLKCPNLNITDISLPNTIITWNWGDTTSLDSLAGNVSHEYVYDGNYVIIVKYKNLADSLVTCSFPIKIKCHNNVEIFVKEECSCEGIRTNFLLTNCTSTDLLHWTLGDGTTLDGLCGQNINDPTGATVGTYDNFYHYYQNYSTYLGDQFTYTLRIGNGATTTRIIPHTIQGIVIGRPGATNYYTTPAVYRLFYNNRTYNGINNGIRQKVYVMGKLSLLGTTSTRSVINYNFSNANISFAENSELEVAYGSRLTTNVSDFTNMDCRDNLCCWWNGIKVKSGDLISNNCNYNHALDAIRPYSIIAKKSFPGGPLPFPAPKMARLDLINNHFNENYVGIRATNGDFNFTKFQNNVFSAANVCPNPKSDLGFAIPNGIKSDPTNPNDMNSSQGFAAIYTNGLNNFNLATAVSTNNTISNSADGIFMDNTNAIITGCNFNNHMSDGIFRQGNQGPGHGIYFNHGQIAHNRCTVYSNNFDKCEFGITGQSRSTTSELEVRNNFMDNVAKGVRISTDVGECTANIHHNNIKVRLVEPQTTKNQDRYGVGIFDSNNQSSTPLSHHVDHNLINLLVPNSNRIGHGIIIIGENVPYSKYNGKKTINYITQATVIGNYVNGNIENIKNAIQIEKYSDCLVTDNDLILRDNATAYSEEDGITIKASSFTRALNNNTYAGAQGIRLDGSPSSLIESNTLDNARMDFWQMGASEKSDIRCNTFAGDCEHGVKYSSGTTDDQVDKGNLWTGSYQKEGCFKEKGILDVYYVNKNIQDNSTSSNMIINDRTGPNVCGEIIGLELDTCNGLPCFADPCNGCSDLLYHATALDDMGQGYKGLYLYDLYKESLTYPTYFTDATVNLDILDKFNQSDLGPFYPVLHNIENIYTGINTDNIKELDKQLEDNYILLEGIMTNTLDSTTMDSLANIIQNNINDIKETYNANISEYNDIENARILNTKNALNSINTTLNDAQWDLQTVLSLQLKKIAGDSYNDIELEILKQIGEQCASEKGLAVYLASALYTEATGLTISQDPSCNAVSNFSNKFAIERVGKDLLDKVIISPNPANNTINITGLDIMHSYDLTLFDFTGKIVTIYNQYHNAQNIDVANLSQGIYIIKVKDVITNQLTAHKLSIIK
jgi:Secretion system C-terminal sorting domain